MTKLEAIGLLNELLALEQRQLALRFTESTCFISDLSVDEAQLVHRLCHRAQLHGEMLTDAITALGGTPGMRVGDINTAHLHFQQLEHVWPMIAEDQQKIVAAYRIAAEKSAPVARAAKTIGEILADHTKILETIEQRNDQEVAT